MLLAPLRDEIVGLLSSTHDVQQAQMRLADWAEERAQDSEIALAFYRPMVLSDLAGRLFVYDVEIQGRLRKLRDDVQRPAFLSLPFTAAVEYAQTRGLVDDEGLSDLLRTYRARGEEASQLLLRIVQRKTADHLTRAVEEGRTLAQFIEDVERDSVALGIGPRHHGYLENVFRTGVQSAYGAGRFVAMTQPAVMEARPFVEYRTVGDNRVRPAHAAMDGKQWAITDREWHRFNPPNDYMCRCSMVTLDPDEVDESQLGRELGADAQPHPRFDVSPSVMVETPLVASAAT